MANILWNDSSLLPPPVNTYKNTENNIDYQKLRGIVEDMFNVVENQQIFHSEAAVVTRLIYKLGRKFRHDIGYSFLNRTNTALLKYNSLDFLNSVKTFSSVVSECESYLPTRQMFEYVLIRLQTFSKLMTRIVLCARKGATYYFDRIKRGDALWLSFMPYIVLSRIWYLARHLLKNACKWYNLLIPFRTELKIIGVPFIPTDYNFPNDLSLWLDLDWLNEKAGQMWQSGVINSFLKINSGNNNDDDDKNTDIVDKILKDNASDMYLSYSKMEKIASNDIGETISRDKFIKQTCENNVDFSTNLDNDDVVMDMNNATKRGKHKIKPVCSNDHSLDKVYNKKDLKIFLKNEECYRNQENKLSLTSQLGFMQWQSLKSVVLKLNDSNKLKFNKKLIKLWNSKM